MEDELDLGGWGEFSLVLAIEKIVYTIHAMNFTWNEIKRQTNLKRHGLDFADAFQVFAGYTLTRPDTRFDYGKRVFPRWGCWGSRWW